MSETRNEQRETSATPATPVQTWRPAFEVISLACEISAYAPDDGGPLF
jgi:hypothetical protein